MRAGVSNSLTGSDGAGARASPGVVLAGCWAHVFRQFEEAKPDHPEAERALAWIGALYEIDDRAGEDVALRAELRRTEAAARTRRLQDLAVGARYAHVAVDRQGRRIRDRELGPTDSLRRRRSRSARQQRHRARDSWPRRRPQESLRLESRRGTEVEATLYTVLETAKIHGVDPAAYLQAAITAADRGVALMPREFAVLTGDAAASP